MKLDENIAQFLSLETPAQRLAYPKNLTIYRGGIIPPPSDYLPFKKLGFRYENISLPCGQGCGSGSGRIRTFLVGSGSGAGSGKFLPDPDPISTYFGNVKLYKQGKNMLKIKV